MSAERHAEVGIPTWSGLFCDSNITAAGPGAFLRVSVFTETEKP